jgi:hypothetical protein
MITPIHEHHMTVTNTKPSSNSTDSSIWTWRKWVAVATSRPIADSSSEAKNVYDSISRIVTISTPRNR